MTTLASDIALTPAAAARVEAIAARQNKPAILRLSVEGGRGAATRSEEPASVTLDVSVLGAGFLGHGVAGLLRAGLVREHREDTYAELARAMRTAVEPETSVGF